MQRRMTALVCAIAWFATGKATAEQIAIVGATVLPMTGAERLADQTIIVDGDKIVTVGPRRQVNVPIGARTIDGRGKVVMPGLVDMHMHVSPAPGKPGDSTQRALAFSLTHGVTTARSMIGNPAHLEARAAIESGALAGPRLYLAAQPIATQNTTTPEQAREKVAAAKAAGFDLMKAHGVDDVAVWQAMIDEAKARGLPVGGHVSNSVGLMRALAGGQQIEHMDGAFAELLPSGVTRDFAQIAPPEVLTALVATPQAHVDALAKKVAAAGNYHVPTLAAFERITALGKPESELMKDPDSGFVADWIHGQWRQQRQGLADFGFTAADGEHMRVLRRRLALAFHKAGVPLMAGSDTPHPFHVWGSGLHRELETLVAAGLTPLEAIRSATIVPRNYFRSLPGQGSALGWKADFGTVEAGARADLILLREDPSRAIAALKTLDTVIAGGRVYDRSALDALLSKAKADAKLQPPPPPQQ